MAQRDLHLSPAGAESDRSGGLPPRDPKLQSTIADLPSDLPRGRGVWLARAAPASAGDRQVEHAATLGLDALAIGVETGSARILTELSQLDDVLASWNTVPAVTDFRTAMKDTVLHQA
ncbi:MAG: hypothetical protein ACRDRT_18415 [Pseudonocardiaceae bacterium]